MNGNEDIRKGFERLETAETSSGVMKGKYEEMQNTQLCLSEMCIYDSMTTCSIQKNQF